MRSLSASVKRVRVFFILVVVLAIANLVSAQSETEAKRKLSQHALQAQPVIAHAAIARAAKGSVPPPAVDNWNGGGGANNNWSDNSNWSNGAPSGQSVVIGLTTAATVEDDNASITALTLSHSGDSVGLANNTTLTVSGNISNAGTISLNSGGNNTALDIGANLTLSGAGSVVLGTGGPNFITGASGTILTNASTISGGGGGSSDTVGNGNLVLANTGTINANVSAANLYVSPGGASTNTGTLEATGGGQLVLNASSWTQSGAGKISAGTGSDVVLVNGVSVTGGILTSTGTGFVASGANQNVTLSNLTIAGTYDAQNNSTTYLSGTITNNGTINLQSAGNNTNLNLTANTTFAGTGSVVLGTGGPNFINGTAGDVLTNKETITGVGNIGEGNLTLANIGTINANISPTVSTGALTLQPGTGGMTNIGTLEATNGGSLSFDGGAVTNTGGIIKAVGADTKGNASTVYLGNSVSITGGTLTTSGAGVIDNAANQYAYLTNVTNNGTYNVLNNAETVISGTITNNGTINLLSAGNNTELFVTANSTLTGTGSVVMGNGGPNFITGNAGITLTNAETIEGVGNIGNGNLAVVNNATINANVNGATLTLQPGAASINTKTLEATNGGTLVFNSGTWTNTGGIITAATGSGVDLANSVSITGGTLSSTGTGVIYNNANQYANLANLTIDGTYQIQNNAQTNISGTITNNGQMQINSSGNNTALYVSANATLNGTGSVVMGNGGPNFISGASGTTLTNAETIEGAGTIGNGITIVNNGTINSNISGGNLILEPALASINTKTLEATNGGTLTFNGSSWTQTGAGTITAANGSAVDVANNASITGGTLTTVGTGVIYNNANQYAYLTSLTNNGTYQVQNNAETILAGTITNNGQIQINSSGNNTVLGINGAVTLAGTGSVVLGSGGPNFIVGTGTTPILTSDNTIEGTGNIGNGSMGFTNNGTVNSNVSGGTLAINVNGSGFTNYNGTTHTLTGGTYIANPGNITFAAGNSIGITTLAANVVEEGGGQLINTTSGTNALTGLTSITSTGALTTNINFTDAGAFSNAGSLTILGSTTFKVRSLAQISGTTLTAGTYVLDSNLILTGAAQNITTNDASVTLAGGTIQDGPTATNALKNLATNAGSLTLANHANFTTVGNFSNTGSLTVNTGSTFTDSGTLAQISGTTLSGGTFVLGGNLALTTGTANITTNSAVLTLEGGTIFNSSNSTNALANLNKNTDKLTLQSGANFTTVGNFTNGGALTVNSGSTFAINGNLTNYSTTTKTLTGGTFVVGGTLSADNLNIVTDAAAITLNGTGELKNTTTGTSALANLSTIGSTGSLTLGVDANFTTAGNFTNSGKLTVNSGSTFSVAGTLSNLSSGTLTGGTYTVGGTLQLTAANGGITTNAANLTLTGKTAKILDGTTNALAGFNNNTGSLTLTNGATLTTATTGNFSNSGTVTVSKGTVLTAGGTTSAYNQTAGTTTVDGTLVGHGTKGISVTGGTLQGAGTLTANVSNGATINVGDAGKAGLLSITGTYTQLSSGTMNVSIGGTAVGSLYSQLKVTGTASLGGTLTAALVNSFTPTVGQTFTLLTAKSVSGTYSNSTIAISGTEHFVVSYTSTSVVLTVASGAASTSSPAGSNLAEMLVASAKPTSGISQLLSSKATSTRSNVAKPIAGQGTLHRVNAPISKPIFVAGGVNGARHIILAGGIAQNNLRGWQHMVPGTPSWDHVRGIAVAEGTGAQSANLNGPRSNLARPISHDWTTAKEAPVRAPLAGWTDVANSHRVPVKILTPSLPRMR